MKPDELWVEGDKLLVTYGAFKNTPVTLIKKEKDGLFLVELTDRKRTVLPFDSLKLISRPVYSCLFRKGKDNATLFLNRALNRFLGKYVNSDIKIVLLEDELNRLSDNSVVRLKLGRNAGKWWVPFDNEIGWVVSVTGDKDSILDYKINFEKMPDGLRVG